MIITKDMFDKKVPIEMFPTRLDSATDLYVNTKNGLVLYNIKPDTWNVLYPFFQQNHKFTIDSYNIQNKDITFKELIDLYKSVYHSEYELEKGYDEERRKDILIEEFNDTFGVTGTSIKEKLDSHFELKYSKSMNVYTLYYLEYYVADKIDDINILLDQKVYEQEFLKLDNSSIPTEINGIKLDDSLLMLNDKEKLQILKDNIILS